MFFQSFLTENSIHFWLQFQSFHSPSWHATKLSSRSHSVLLYAQPLSQIIERHSLSHSEVADESQLYNSVPLEQFVSCISNMQSYVANVKHWMTQSKLQFNEDKTEALLVVSQNSPNLPLSINIGQNNICFSRSVQNLDMIFL